MNLELKPINYNDLPTHEVYIVSINNNKVEALTGHFERDSSNNSIIGKCGNKILYNPSHYYELKDIQDSLEAQIIEQLLPQASGERRSVDDNKIYKYLEVKSHDKKEPVKRIDITDKTEEEISKIGQHYFSKLNRDYQIYDIFESKIKLNEIS